MPPIQTATPPTTQDWTLPLDERVADLVSRLTQSEKFNQVRRVMRCIGMARAERVASRGPPCPTMQVWSISPAIARLNISAYNWRSNCLHGWCVIPIRRHTPSRNEAAPKPRARGEPTNRRAESGGNWLKNETFVLPPGGRYAPLRHAHYGSVRLNPP